MQLSKEHEWITGSLMSIKNNCISFNKKKEICDCVFAINIFRVCFSHPIKLQRWKNIFFQLPLFKTNKSVPYFNGYYVNSNYFLIFNFNSIVLNFNLKQYFCCYNPMHVSLRILKYCMLGIIKLYYLEVCYKQYLFQTFSTNIFLKRSLF